MIERLIDMPEGAKKVQPGAEARFAGAGHAFGEDFQPGRQRLERLHRMDAVGEEGQFIGDGAVTRQNGQQLLEARLGECALKMHPQTHGGAGQVFDGWGGFHIFFLLDMCKSLF
jgi:hypothetical protein